MTIYESMSRWSERREQRRVQRWYKNRDRMANYLTTWRNWPRQKALITTYFACLACYLVIIVVQFWWEPALIAGLPVTAVLLTSWVMLRITIEGRDSAPEEVLDEYESQVINRWTRLSWNLLITVCVLTTWALIFGGTTFLSHEKDTTVLPTILSFTPGKYLYSLGYLFLTLFLAIVCLPAVGYATHFGPRKALEEDEFT